MVTMILAMVLIAAAAICQSKCLKKDHLLPDTQKLNLSISYLDIP